MAETGQSMATIVRSAKKTSPGLQACNGPNGPVRSMSAQGSTTSGWGRVKVAGGGVGAFLAQLFMVFIGTAPF